MDIVPGVVILITFHFLTATAASDKTLKMVQVLFRHGDRTPVDAYPTDKYQESYWPQGFDWLTSDGMRQHYELGQFLRRRYIEGAHLLDPDYSRHQIQIWSTDVDRTLMSAAVDLSGMFPPSGGQLWNPNITWQPIPIHTMPAREDFYLSYSADCPKYNELQKASLHDEDYLKVSRDNAKFMKDLNTNSGFNGSIAVTNIFQVSDPLFVEKWKGLDLPSWTEEEGFWSTLDTISTYAMGQLVGSTAKARLRGGPLLGLMIQNMRDALNTSLPQDAKYQFHMYSAHDVTITSLLGAMQLFNDIKPPYASAVIVELWNDTASGPFVRVLYRNTTEHEPYVLALDGCTVNCSFEKFVTLTKDRTLAEADIRKECGLLVTPINYWIPTFVGIALGLMLIAFVAIYVIAINRRTDYSHRVLQNEATDP